MRRVRYRDAEGGQLELLLGEAEETEDLFAEREVLGGLLGVAELLSKLARLTVQREAFER